jgi:hypothetical protein
MSSLKLRLDGIRQILLAHHMAGGGFPSASKGAEREVLVSRQSVSAALSVRLRGDR